jgi:hypothetical protein
MSDTVGAPQQPKGPLATVLLGACSQSACARETTPDALLGLRSGAA